jgi:stage II sporulation protein D
VLAAGGVALVLGAGAMATPGATAAPAPAAPKLAAHHRAVPAALPPASAGASAAAMAGRIAGDTSWARASGRPAAPAVAGSTVVLTGHGDGNGVGLGQYGAFGYASVSHETWKPIVEHFYAGTYLVPVSAATEATAVKVNLSELDTAPTTPIQVATAGAELYVNGSRRGARDVVTHVDLPKTVTVSRGDIEVDLPGVGWRAYQGSLQVQSDGQTWNVVPLEDYVAGVVPSESIASWGSEGGEAALQAQAVASRSYALAYIAAAGRICDVSVCQVYGGDAAYQPDPSYTIAAATSTAGYVMCTVRDATCPPADIALTQFGASTGGWTKPAPPFVAEVDTGDAVAGNPFHTWVSGGYCPTTFSTSTVIADTGAGMSSLTGAKVTQRNGDGDFGGRALEVELTGRTAGGAEITYSLSGDAFAADLHLCSDWFAFEAS